MSNVTTKALSNAPSAANGASVTLAGSAWASSAWVQLIASTANAIQIESIAVSWGTLTGTFVDYEIDISTGAAAAEVVIATIAGCNSDGGGATGGSDYAQRLGIILDNIPTSTRVAVRLRVATTDSTSSNVSISYYNGNDSLDQIATALQVIPSAAAGLAVSSSGTVWTNGSYVQVTAGFGSSVYLLGIAVNATVPPSSPYEIDLATGGSGSETVITTLRGYYYNTNTGAAYIYLSVPYPIAASTRIAIRIRDNNSVSYAWGLKLMYVNQGAVAAPTGYASWASQTISQPFIANDLQQI